MADTLKKMKIMIIVLSILLGLSLAALAGVIIHGQLRPSSASAVIPDNYIDPQGGHSTTGEKTAQLGKSPVLLCAAVPMVTPFGNAPVMAFSKAVISSDSAKETVISIYKNHAEDSEPFHLANMFPGDSETNTYLVEVSHKGTVTVRFRADIRAGYEKLSEVLKCKVALRGENKTLYDGLMRDMPESINHRISSIDRTTTELTYDMTVYLDTDVGNEHMNRELVADFRWWVEERDSDTTEPEDSAGADNATKPDDTTKPDEEIDPDDGELVAPPTGDHTYFTIFFLFAILFLLILIRPKSRRKRDE